VADQITDQINKLNDFIQSDRNIRTALITTLAIQKPRIFVNGFDSKGTKIGTYGVKPISISKKNQARNTGKTYFKGGYAEYKRAVGKNPGYVILRNTDQMFMDYGLVGSSGKYGFGFQNSANYDKSQWMETKYKKDIFSISDNEINVLTNVLVDQLNRAF
jgi:hypothetical protein